MYEQFFGLTEKPFSLSTNPRFVFCSRQYDEAEGQLIYGIKNREGLMLVTGSAGTGKTTLCRHLVEALERENVLSALILNPLLDGMEMLAAILSEFGVNVPDGGSRKELLDRLKQFLLAQLALGRNCVAIFDEAQHLSPELLEQIRVLSNLEADRERLLQIVLVGQPLLLDVVRAPNLAQLDQRISIRCTLNDLDEGETDRYIHHRLDVAGARGQVQFAPRTVREVHRGSRGAPRLINLICDRALLAGYAAQTRDIQPSHVRKAIDALLGEDADVSANTANVRQKWRLRLAATAAIVIATVGVAGASWWWRRNLSPDEALYRRATTASIAADAERDLGAFLAKFPASSHVNEALLRLAQLELSRGDRTPAIQHLTRLAEHAPTGLAHARAVVLTALVRIDGADTTTACESISPDLASVASADSSLARRLTALSSVCAARSGAASLAPPIDSAAHVAASGDSVAAKGAKRGAPPTVRP